MPSQERSRRRYQAIIEATETLLQTNNIEDLSLYDIAKQAKIAPASVHYLFSTVAAIHVELNRLYNEQLTAKVLEANRNKLTTKNSSWQELTRAHMETSRAVLNGHRAMSEIMLGPALHRSSRAKNRETNAFFAQSVLAVTRQRFVMPEIPDLERVYLFAAEISEGLWAGAYATNGTIDDETFAESLRATVAYLRCFLPDTLMVRETESNEKL
ncbi:DNA-binding transcriptional regulator, AcrR family [Ralstonia sp. 25mfcol4.1]|uniref:TetR/AcrR family transcriptional regulator n=1 Tax=Ralstonia sp. 25mfcol4.1 TaxID=1761899 RepID=UPI00048A53FE|nr:TetR family transcriptional regulator [Ralstonia sp. 25mfcol4.1]SDP77547.1 DNA-binding transcriptional regulator, AcrR family [Ralstonia sp. 25mfcol4.1]